MKNICLLLFMVISLTPSVFAQLLPKDNGKTYQNAQYLKKATVTPSTTIPVWNTGKGEWEAVTADSLMTSTVVASLPATRNLSKKQFLNKADSSDFQLINDSVYIYKRYKGSSIPSSLSTTYNAGITVGGKGISVTYKVTPETDINITHEAATGYVTTYRLQRDNKTIKPINTPQFSTLSALPAPESIVSGITTTYKGVNVFITSDSSEYTPQYIIGTKFLRWHRISPIKIYNATMPVDSFLVGSQYVYNRCKVLRYGVNTNSPNASKEYVSTEDGKFYPVNLELNLVDFGLLSATTNKQRRVAIQTCIDSAIATGLLGNYDFSYIRVKMPFGRFVIDSTLHLGYGQSFSQLIFEGSGNSFYGQNFRGTTIQIATSDQQVINVQGGRQTIIENLTLEGQNNFTPTITGDRSSKALFIKSGLHANADSRYAPHAGVTIDAYSGTRPATSYPDVHYPTYSGITTQYGKLHSSAITIKHVNFVYLVAGVVNQPCDADGNGDFTRLDNCTFINSTYGLSVGNTQSRNTTVTNSEGGVLWTDFVTTAHGRQNGRLSSVLGYGTGLSFQTFNIGNMSVNGSLYVRDYYAEYIQRLGTFGSNASGNASILFEGGTYSDDEGATPQSGVTNSFLESIGSHSITFNAFSFAAGKHLHFDLNQTHIFLNNCTVITNPLNGELAGVSATDTARLQFRYATKGVTASDANLLHVLTSKASTDAALYADDATPFGDSRVYTNDNYNRISMHGNKDFKPTLGILSQSIFNTDITYPRNELDNFNCNYVGKRFAFATGATTQGKGYAKGDVLTLTQQGLVFIVEEGISTRTDSLICTLINNYKWNPSTGAFTGYVNTISGGAGSPLTGNLLWTSSRRFISPQPIYGYFTEGSRFVKNLTDQRGNAYSNASLPIGTPLWGGEFNAVSPFLNYYTCIMYKVGTDSLYLSQPALKTGRFPIGNTFNARIYRFIDAQNLESGRISNTAITIPTISALATGTATVTVTGAALGDKVNIVPRTDLATGLSIAYAYVSAINTVKIGFTAATAFTTAAVNFDITTIK